MQSKTKMSGNAFKKMISGGKSYVPAKAAQALKKAGLSSLLYSGSVSRDQAVRAIKTLEAQKDLPAVDPSGMWQKASIKEQTAQALVAEQRRRGHVKYAMATEIAEEMAKEEAEWRQQVTGHNPKKYFGKLTDELEEEKQKREEAIAAERLARGQLLNAAAKGQKPNLGAPKMAEPPDIFSGL